MKKTDLAYFAGLFDGEGCISIIHQTKKGRPYLTLMVQIVNTRPWVCQSFKFTFSGRVIFRKAFRKHWQDYWAWAANGKQALDFLRVIKPYLKLKQGEAEVAIKFQEMRSTRKYSCLTEAEMILLEEQRRLLKDLKTKK